MKRKTLIEEIAKVLHTHEFGCAPEEFEEIHGFKKREWGDWSLERFVDNQLAEHERDDYRYTAQKVVEFLESRNALQGIYINNKKELVGK